MVFLSSDILVKIEDGLYVFKFIVLKVQIWFTNRMFFRNFAHHEKFLI